jgi:hypothetical protein
MATSNGIICKEAPPVARLCQQAAGHFCLKRATAFTGMRTAQDNIMKFMNIPKSTFIAFVLFCVGINALKAEAKPLDIPVVNRSFENGMDGWLVWKKYTGQATVEEGIAHSGNHALLIDGRTKAANPLASQSVTNIQGNATYQLSVWARVAPGSPPVTAGVKIEGYTADNRNVDQLNESMKLSDDKWHLITATLPLSAGTVRASLLLRVYGKGAVLFDDVAFETSGISVASPTKKALVIGQEEKVQYELNLYYPWKSTFPPKIIADLYSSDKLVAAHLPTTVERGKDDRHFFATVSVKAPEAGDYQLHFSLHQNEQEVSSYFPAELFTIVPDRKPQYLTDRGTILHGGKPFFPISIYHPGFTEEILQQLAEQGFNTIVSAPNYNADQLGPLLDRAQKYGLAVDVPLHGYGQVAKNLPESLEKIRRYADHPAVLDWKILDEPMYNRKVASEIPQVYRALKAADGKNPLEITLSPGDDLEFYKNFSDIIQRDIYPVPSHPLTQVSDVARETFLAKQPWQSLSVVLSSGWTADLKTQPTAARARCMVYLALINGAKEISWYSMFDPGWNLTKTPLWPHLKDINAEITELSMPLMEGEMVTGISANTSKVLFTARKYEGKLYILLTNPHDETASFTLQIPESQNLKNATHQMNISLDAFGSKTLVLE